MIQKTHHFQLDHANNRQAQIGHTDLIRVELPESSSSGYRWQLAPHVKLPGLKLIDQQFSEHQTHTTGTRTFVFRPTGEQTHASLQFCLKRPSGCERSTLQQFALDVAIAGSSLNA